MARRLILALLLLTVPVSVMAMPMLLTIAAYAAAAYKFYLVSFALSVAANALANRQQRRAQRRMMDATNDALTDRNVTVISADSPRPVVYGNPAPIGGSTVAMFTSGDRDEFAHMVIVFNSRESHAIDEIYIDGDPVGTVDANGWVTGGAFLEVSNDKISTQIVTFDGSGSATIRNKLIDRVISAVDSSWSSGGDVDNQATNWPVSAAPGVTDTVLTGPPDMTLSVHCLYREASARVNVQRHLSPGGVDTADAFLMSRRPDKWTAAHKLSGYTYIVLTLDKNLSRFQGGPPNVTASGRWSKVYDPRTTLTAYSTNPALCLADYLTSSCGYHTTTAEINSTDWIAAANACETASWSSNAASALSTELYRCDGRFTTDADRDSVRDQIADSMAGDCYMSGGQWRIRAGVWTAPVQTLTDDDCMGRIRIVQGSNSIKARYNGCKGKYAPWWGGGTTPDFPPYQNATLRAADGRDKFADLSLPFVHSDQRCTQIARIRTEVSRGGLTIEYPASMAAWALQPGDRVSITNAEYQWTNKTFRITDWGFGLTSPVVLILVEDVAAYYDLADAVVVDQAPNTGLANPQIVPTAGESLRAYSGTNELLRQSDRTIVTRLRVTWDLAASNYVTQSGQVQLQWRSAVDEDVTRWRSTIILPGDSTQHIWDNVPDGAVVIVRHRFINALGRTSAWIYITHQVVGKTALPGDVPWALYNDGVLSWGTVSDIDLAGYAWRYTSGANVNWGAGLPLHDGLILATPWRPGAMPTGTVTLMVKARDTSGNESANPAYIVLELGDALTGNVLETWPQAPTFADGTITNGTVSGGTLVADDGSELFWLDGDALVWSPPDELMWSAPVYKEMTYIVEIRPTAAGVMTITSDIDGEDVRIEYARGDSTLAWLPGTDYAWAPADDLFWGSPSDYQPWPGTLSVIKDEIITIRVTTAAGSTQGVIHTLTPTLDVPDVEESLEDVVISAGGTRLPITRTYSVIKNVQITVQADGGTGISARTRDKHAILGPMTDVLDAAGVATTGLVDARIQGY